MELLTLIGIGVVFSMLVMPWLAYTSSRRAHDRITELLSELRDQRVRLEQALRQIEQLRAQQRAPAPQPESAPTAAAPPAAAAEPPQAAPITVPAEPATLPPAVPDSIAAAAPPLQSLEAEEEITAELPALDPAAMAEAAAIESPLTISQPELEIEREGEKPSTAGQIQRDPEPPIAAAEPAKSAEQWRTPEPLPVSEFDRRIAHWLGLAREWLFGGNLVAKVGLLILFIGVAFLVRLASSYVSVPVELRLAGVAAGAIALLTWGWRIRERRRGIALPVQGAALAILMLVTFGAFKLFNVLPGGAAFALLFLLVAFTCVLAVLQDALWLAVFGISGGFAAPILTSTNSGSHVALFSYYCLLNAGVLAIALKRSWRMLNVLGFAFTFIVGAAWGVQRYVPENYASAQPFLIAFWLFYVAIAVLYGWRREPQLKSYVDGTLVFGVPTAGMALQYGLVKDMPFGMALSSLVIALTYATTASLLWRWRRGSLRLLVESFLALAVVFGTLAIPLAFDGRWTSAVWAVEGAAIVWIGLKQKQALAWRFGIAVQLASWVSFVSAITGLDPGAALANNLGLGFLLLGGAGVLMALMFRQQNTATEEGVALSAEERARERFGKLAGGFIIAAAVWLLLGLWVEAWLRLSGGPRATTLVATALVLVIGLVQLAKRAAWRLPALVGGAVAVVAGAVFARLMLVTMDWHNFERYPQARFGELLSEGPLLGGLLLCAGALISSLAFKRRGVAEAEEQAWVSRETAVWFLVAVFWWCGFALHGLAHLTSWLTQSREFGQGLYTISFWAAYGTGLVLSALAWMLLAIRRQLLEPRWALQTFWPALTWAGAVMFFVQVSWGLGWRPRNWSALPVTTLPVALADAFQGLVAGPLLGAQLLCGVAAYGISRMARGLLPYEATPADRSRSNAYWLVVFGLTWHLLLLDELTKFAVRVAATLGTANAGWQLQYPQAALLLVAMSGALFIWMAQRRAFPTLRWLAAPAFMLQALASAIILGVLYLQGELPGAVTGSALAGCWLALAWSLRQWLRSDWPLPRPSLKALHFGRVIAPWLMLMPVVSLNLARWIWDGAPPSRGWLLAGQWPDYLASWLGILSLLLLLRQCRRDGWPVQPLQDWYEKVLIPVATLWGVLLAIYWNLRQDGSMLPLPYLPVLNPLDITTGFVALLATLVWRTNAAVISSNLRGSAIKLSMGLAFAWFNLMLLRTAAKYLPLPYRFDALYASQFVQAMLSIVWTLTAFFLMRFAARRMSKPLWTIGAALLAVVVAKLFLIDLSNVGSVARIVSFLGVGGLMLLIGYLAPLPRSAAAAENKV